MEAEPQLAQAPPFAEHALVAVPAPAADDLQLALLPRGRARQQPEQPDDLPVSIQRRLQEKATNADRKRHLLDGLPEPAGRALGTI